MKNVKNIFVFVLAMVGIIIAFQNTDQVETQILFFTITMPRAVLLFLTLLIGFITGMMVTFIISSKWSSRKKTK